MSPVPKMSQGVPRVEAVQVDRTMAEAIATLVNQAFAIELFFVEGDRIAPDAVRRLASGAQSRFFVAFDEHDSPIGCIYAEVRPGGVGYFGLLSVDPSQRGKGIGYQLIQRAETFLRERGCQRVEITVVDLRTELFPYYERHGFRTDGRTEAFPREAKQPCQLIYMTRPLD